MMHKQKISVVIPAYNEEKRLPTVLDALLAQTTVPDEVIVSLNACTDGTESVAKKYEKKFLEKGSVLITIIEPQKGVARARNVGFKLAKFQIIASTDSDAKPARDWVANILKHFETKDSIAVTGKITMVEAPFLVEFITKIGWYKVLHNLGYLLFGIKGLHTANAAFKKEFVTRCGGFDNNIVNPEGNDDFEISSRLMDLGPLRFDSSLHVEMSYRRYSSFLKSLKVGGNRLSAWIDVAKKYRKRRRTS